MGILDLIAILVTLAAVFTFVNIHYIKLPATIGLMILALVLSTTILAVGLVFEPVLNVAKAIMNEFDFAEVLLNVMLSFLLFAGALHVDFQKLKEQAVPVLVMASVGTLISTFVAGTASYYFFHMLDLGFELSYIHCLLFGALIAPTDPIAVLAILKTTSVAKSLSIKIEGESLFNDGIGVVVFLTILSIAGFGGHGGGEHEATTMLSVVTLFGQEVFGGVLMGLILGFLGYYLLVIIDNEHMELEVLVTLSLVLIGSQVAAALHLSGPLAMVVMGLIIGQGNSHEPNEHGEVEEGIAGEYVITFWKLVDEALNAILFILIGLEILVVIDAFRPAFLIAGLGSILIVLMSRLLGVSIPVLGMMPFMKFEKGSIGLMSWGGLKGGISVALALSLKDNLGLEFPNTFNLIISCTYSVVVFSILGQGLTIKPLVKKIT